jgi:hypothetical protein
MDTRQHGSGLRLDAGQGDVRAGDPGLGDELFDSRAPLALSSGTRRMRRKMTRGDWPRRRKISSSSLATPKKNGPVIAAFRTDPYFRVGVPVEVDDVDSRMLDPRRTWTDKDCMMQARSALSCCSPRISGNARTRGKARSWPQR